MCLRSRKTNALRSTLSIRSDNIVQPVSNSSEAVVAFSPKILSHHRLSFLGHSSVSGTRSLARVRPVTALPPPPSTLFIAQRVDSRHTHTQLLRLVPSCLTLLALKEIKRLFHEHSRKRCDRHCAIFLLQDDQPVMVLSQVSSGPPPQRLIMSIPRQRSVNNITTPSRPNSVARPSDDEPRTAVKVGMLTLLYAEA